MPFGQRHVAINIYNICKGHLGSKTLGQFENLVFVIMSTRENVRLIARCSSLSSYSMNHVIFYVQKNVPQIMSLTLCKSQKLFNFPLEKLLLLMYYVNWG